MSEESSCTSAELVLKTTGSLETVADEFALLESSRFAYKDNPALGVGAVLWFDMVVQYCELVEFLWSSLTREADIQIRCT